MASLDFGKCLQSLASRRERPSHAKLRSATHRYGNRTKPLASGGRLTADDVQLKRRQLEDFLTQIARSVLAVGVHDVQPGQFLPEASMQQVAGRTRIGQVGGRHQDGEQQSETVNSEMPLAPLHFLAAVEATLAAGHRRLDRLDVDRRTARRWVSAGLLADLAAKGFVNPFPSPIPAPATIPSLDGAPGRKIMGSKRHWQPVRSR
jgi:hypothetical protein